MTLSPSEQALIDMWAGNALAGLIASRFYEGSADWNISTEETMDEQVKTSFDYAELMLKERSRILNASKEE